MYLYIVKIKYYHTTGTLFKPGDIIGGPGLRVYMNTTPIPHGTIQSVVEGGFACWKDYLETSLKNSAEYWDKREEWNKNPVGDKPEWPETKNSKPVKLIVYEVKPYDIPVFGRHNDEYVAIDMFVEIVRIVGNAKGILQNHKRKFGNGAKAWHFGAKAISPTKLKIKNGNKKHRTK